ncbi:MAG: hypothetical protein ACRD82_23710, partial [Blastocatellia bacterium]
LRQDAVFCHGSHAGSDAYPGQNFFETEARLKRKSQRDQSSHLNIQSNILTTTKDETEVYDFTIRQLFQGVKTMFTRNQIIACVVRQYGTGQFKSCVSLNKGSTICLSTHDDEQSATESINRFWQFLESKKSEINQPEDVSLFMKLFSSGEMALAV